MRLIDADALIPDHMVVSTTTNSECKMYVSMEQINNQPTVEPTHRGEWVQKSRKLDLCTMWWYECSECGSKPPNDKYGHPNYLSRYCPSCGSKMSEGEEE